MGINEVRSKYNENLPKYERLANLLAEKIPNQIQTRIHSIKYRIKDFESFYEKISRKGYDKPFEQCTDTIGFRIICLFKGQIKQIVRLLKKEYRVIEEIQQRKDVDRFAYDSVHLIIRLKKDNNTQKDFKELKIPCEIQIRTILQEAWAEIEHSLNYKQIGIDKTMQRKINALSAMLEIADDEFQEIKNTYQKQIKEPIKIDKLTPEILYHYCKKTFPWGWKIKGMFDVENISEYDKLLYQCEKKGITTLKNLNDLYIERKDNIMKYDAKHVKDVLNSPTQWPTLYKKVKETNHFFSPTLLLSIMIKELYKEN